MNREVSDDLFRADALSAHGGENPMQLHYVQALDGDDEDAFERIEKTHGDPAPRLPREQRRNRPNNT